MLTRCVDCVAGNAFACSTDSLQRGEGGGGDVEVNSYLRAVAFWRSSHNG